MIGSRRKEAPRQVDPGPEAALETNATPTSTRIRQRSPLENTKAVTVTRGQVPFHDCDPLAICWHGHYYKYLEIGRTAHLKRFRLDVPDFIEMGYRLVVIESRCRYAFPLRYDERFAVSTRFIDTDMRLHIGYEITNLTHGRRSAKAWTSLVCTDLDGTMLLETPEEIRCRIAGGTC